MKSDTLSIFRLFPKSIEKESIQILTQKTNHQRFSIKKEKFIIISPIKIKIIKKTKNQKTIKKNAQSQE
jgi:hypothetical protein